MCKSREMWVSDRGYKSGLGLRQWKWKGNGRYESLWRKSQWNCRIADSRCLFPLFLVSSV